MTTLRIYSCVLVNAREELRFILVRKHLHSTFLSAYHSMLHHFKGIDVGVDGQITSPRNSPIDSVQELQRICCLWPPPIISAWNHRFVKVSTTFDKHQLDPFQMCCLNLKVAPNWWEGRMVGSQKSISSPLIICFASSLAKVSENFQVQGLNSDFRWSMAMCS